MYLKVPVMQWKERMSPALTWLPFSADYKTIFLPKYKELSGVQTIR